MARLTKLLVTEGDSWTAGDILNPELEGVTTFINDTRNDEYRLPKVWPHKLAEQLEVDYLNLAIAGSSNDGIVMRLFNKIPLLLREYKPEDLHVIVGWSSPERRDFYFQDDSSDTASWEILYPAQLEQNFEHRFKEDFYKLYLKHLWYQEEYISRFVYHNIALHSFLSNLNIRHTFFNSFYEQVVEKKTGKRPILHSISLHDLVLEVIRNSKCRFNIVNEKLGGLKESYLDIYKNVYFKTTFAQYIKQKTNIYNEKDLFFQYHPTELAHTEWASKLYKEIKVV